MELIVYRDDNYATAWVPRELSKKIADFLKSKNFVEYNADNLARWMENSIDKNTCRQSVIVFSQDIVPDTICHTPSPSSLFRTYLDCGGTIVWIGDVPIFYQGMSPSRARKFEAISDEELEKYNEKAGAERSQVYKDQYGKFGFRWGIGGCFSVLGVMPVFMDFPSSKVSVTDEGKLFGLQNPWYSIRPIIIKSSILQENKPTALATSKPSYLVTTKKTIFRARVRTIREVEERKPSLPTSTELLVKILSLIAPLASAIVALYSLLAGYATMITWFFAGVAVAIPFLYVVYRYLTRETLASAWFKNFDNQPPVSGFIRLWDFKLNRITDKMLEELHRVALARLGKSVSQS